MRDTLRSPKPEEPAKHYHSSRCIMDKLKRCFKSSQTLGIEHDAQRAKYDEFRREYKLRITDQCDKVVEALIKYFKEEDEREERKKIRQVARRRYEQYMERATNESDETRRILVADHVFEEGDEGRLLVGPAADPSPPYTSGYLHEARRVWTD